MRLILNGGGGKEKIGDSVRLFVSLLHGGKVMYVPLAWNNGDPADCIHWFCDLVGDYGVKREQVVLITDAREITAIALESVDGVFIGGGNTYKLLKMLKDCDAFKNLADFIKTDKVIMGGSAGALIFGESIDTCLDDGLGIKSVCDKNIVGLKDTRGFGVLNGYSILPHYLVKPEQADLTAQRVKRLLAEGHKLICLPEETSLYLHDGETTFIGTAEPAIFPKREDIKKQKGGVVLETKRLILRNYKLSDLDDYFEYVSQEKVGKMCGWERHKSKTQSCERLLIEIEKPYQFAIYHKKDKKVIGSVELMKISPEQFPNFDPATTREFGDLLSEKYWGQGIMPEALTAVATYAFENLGIETLVMGNFASNTQSAMAHAKIGFKPFGKIENFALLNGEKTDIILQKLTKEEFFKNKSKEKENGGAI